MPLSTYLSWSSIDREKKKVEWKRERQVIFPFFWQGDIQVGERRGENKRGSLYGEFVTIIHFFSFFFVAFNSFEWVLVCFKTKKKIVIYRKRVAAKIQFLCVWVCLEFLRFSQAPLHQPLCCAVRSRKIGIWLVVDRGNRTRDLPGGGVSNAR